MNNSSEFELKYMSYKNCKYGLHTKLSFRFLSFIWKFYNLQR